MRTSLEQAGGDEASPAGKRVVTLIEELRLVLTCLMSANPLGMSSLRRVSSFTSAVSSLCKTSLMQCLWRATTSQHGFGTLSFTESHAWNLVRSRRGLHTCRNQKPFGLGIIMLTLPSGEQICPDSLHA